MEHIPFDGLGADDVATGLSTTEKQLTVSKLTNYVIVFVGTPDLRNYNKLRTNILSPQI